MWRMGRTAIDGIAINEEAMTADVSTPPVNNMDVNELLKSAIFLALAQASLPLAPFQLCRLLLRKHAGSSRVDLMLKLEDKVVNRICKQIEQTSAVLSSWSGSYFLTVRKHEMMRNALVAMEYQTLGMTILPNYTKAAVVYVPLNAEHRFLEAKQSTIPNAGFGLFLRTTRSIRQGTVLCEYAGRSMASPPRNVALCPYMVELTTPDPAASNRYLDGIDDSGNILCLAALINDHGTDGANVEFVEFDGLPGRVFVTAMRDLRPGDEIFVSYGQSYWDEQARERSGQARSKRSRMEAPLLHRCRRCSAMMPARLTQLHAKTCGDPLSLQKLSNLESLPRNEFTSLDDQMSVQQQFRFDMKLLPKRSITFVNADDSSTFANSHVDVVSFLRVEVLDDDVTMVD